MPPALAPAEPDARLKIDRILTSDYEAVKETAAADRANIFLCRPTHCSSIHRASNAVRVELSLVGKSTNFFPNRFFEPPIVAVRSLRQTIFEIYLLFS
jgi:hypothetical protein